MIDLRIMEAVGIEKTAEWVFSAVNNYVRSTTKDRVEVVKVEVWEHEGNSAIYENDAKVYKTHYIPREGLDYNVDPEIAKTLPTHPEDPNQEELNLENKEEESVQPPVEEKKEYASPLKNKVTKGMGNPFEGTSWG